LVRDLLNLRSVAHDKNVPEYLPANIEISHSIKFSQSIIEIFRQTYNRFIHLILIYSTKIGVTLQNKDIRRYLGYIFIVNIVAILLFLLFGGFI
ncbi:MAG: hypothetical protein DWQ04_08830, partial [Chloroflexi bacterium]